MDRWITAIKADTRAIPQIEKVVQNRPADLVEGCMTRDPNPVFVPQTLERNPATSCESLYPSHSFPREVAGAGVAADIVKCQLRAPQRADYAVAFSDAQWARLQAAFPQGVCDWTQPGIEQQGLAGTWQRFWTPRGRAPSSSAPSQQGNRGPIRKFVDTRTLALSRRRPVPRQCCGTCVDQHGSGSRTRSL